MSLHILISWAAVQLCTPRAGTGHPEGAVLGVWGGVPSANWLPGLLLGAPEPHTAALGGGLGFLNK